MEARLRRPPQASQPGTRQEVMISRRVNIDAQRIEANEAYSSARVRVHLSRRDLPRVAQRFNAGLKDYKHRRQSHQGRLKSQPSLRDLALNWRRAPSIE